MRFLICVIFTFCFLRPEGLRGASFNYLYDSLNRLTNAAYSDGSGESYSYDNVGNRLSRSVSAATNQVDTVPPSIPTNLSTKNFTPSQLGIAWNAAADTGGSGLAGYDIFLNGSLFTTTTDTNFFLAGLLPNVSYCLSVAAVDRSGNLSTRSPELCLTTPIFQQPVLSFFGLNSGKFQFNITGGTPGPYGVYWSSNLINWDLLTNVNLPGSTNFLDFKPSSFSRGFYQLRWNTNTP